MAHRMEFTAEARDHLRDVSGRARAKVLEAIRELLSHEPSRPTRNRKPMRPNPLAPWVLRVGDLREWS
jgi:mRNA-degrading endonuclease RelE of RelBE toxin-antitoxin system